jgi:putative transposase
MSTQRKQYSAEFKARVALEALQGLKTVNALASTYGVHPTQIAHWKHQLQKEMPEIFSARRAKREHDHEALQAQLYQQIGQRKVELDWLKKKLDLSPDAKRELIEPAHLQMSIARQCALVGLLRSTYSYQSCGESAENLTLMRLLDRQYTATPYYGVRRMTAWLRSPGYRVHHKRVARLMQTMGIEALSPKPHLSQTHPAHRVYPSLLRGVSIIRVKQVWSTDITYIRLHGGFLSLVAVMDWCSRYVLSWAVSITMDVGFCLEALERALEAAHPEIFNSDQGAQFTSLDFTGRLAAAGIPISMDGRGRALDNVFVERLWRTVKYEEVYVKDYETPREAIQGLGTFFGRYNELRQQQSLAYQTPAAVYFSSSL